MSLGIGLGAFAGSFKQGYGLGKQMKSDFEDNKFKKEIESSYEDSQKKFQEGLATGAYNEDQFMDIWKSESVPRITNWLLKNGRVKEAMDWEKWGTGEKGTNYAKMYGNAKFQFGVNDMGNFANSLNQMAEFSGIKDYNFSFAPKDDLHPERIRVSSKDGKTIFGDYTREQIPELFETTFSPAASFSHQATQTSKNIAKAPGLIGGVGEKDEPSLSYKDAHKMESEAMDWEEISPDEQQKRILKRQDMSRPSHFKQYSKAGGINGQPMVIVDSRQCTH